MNARPQRRSGNFGALRVEMWAAIRAAAGMLDDPEITPELKLRAVSAIATAAAVYLKMLDPQPPSAVPEAGTDDVVIVNVQERTNGHHGV